MKVLIIGNSQDAHAAHIKKILSQKGALVNYLDVSLFPTNLQMSWQPNSGDGYLKLSADVSWQLEDIKSVYWRNFNSVNIPQLNAYQQTIALNDSMSTIRTIFKDCQARWVNSIEDFRIS